MGGACHDNCLAVIKTRCLRKGYPSPTLSRNVRMLKNTIELLCGLFLSAPALLIGSCIVGSVLAAIRALNRGSAIVGTRT